MVRENIRIYRPGAPIKPFIENIRQVTGMLQRLSRCLAAACSAPSMFVYYPTAPARHHLCLAACGQCCNSVVVLWKGEIDAWTEPNFTVTFSVCVVLYLIKLKGKLMRWFHEHAKLIWKSYMFLSISLDNTLITQASVSKEEIKFVLWKETNW